MPPLDEVRSAVEREWAGERREQAIEEFRRSLRERYQVEVRMPAAEPEVAARP
jgi:hypothetical protein